MSNEYLLGLDNGGSLIKAALFDRAGNQIACESIPTPQDCPSTGFCQRTPESIREANFAVIRRLTDTYGDRIAAVGIAGHGKGLYMLDRQGRPMSPCIASTDNRALSYVRAWEQDGTARKAYALTAQRIMACQPVALLRWIKDNQPEIYGRIGTVLSAKDLVRYFLTGQAYAEYTDVSGTNLVDLYTGTYDTRLTDLFGIPEMAGCLPPIRSSHEICGTVTEEAAIATGLPVGTPVVGGMFDIDACALALGCTKAGDMCIIAGTWSINEMITEKPVSDGSVAMNSIFCDPAYYLAEESSATSAGNLEWFRHQWKVRDYAELERLVASVSPLDCQTYYFPFLYASNLNPRARASFVGMSGDQNLAHMVRTVYEGVVYSHMTHCKTMFSSLNKPEQVRLAGGVVNSPAWSRMFTDALGVPIRVMPDTELGAKGAAMAAGVGCGWYRDYKAAVTACVPEGTVLTPDPAMTAIYEEKYRKYRRIANALDGVWAEI